MAAAAVVLVFVSQALTIAYNRQGRWTALFCTGTDRALPAPLQDENVYRFTWLRRDVSVVGMAGLLFATMGVVLQRADHWYHVFDFGRVYSPLLFFLVVDEKTRSPVGLAPTALMYPRIALQLGSQVVGVVMGVANSLGAS